MDEHHRPMTEEEKAKFKEDFQAVLESYGYTTYLLFLDGPRHRDSSVVVYSSRHHFTLEEFTGWLRKMLDGATGMGSPVRDMLRDAIVPGPVRDGISDN
jgi:hypothetical protein